MLYRNGELSSGEMVFSNSLSYRNRSKTLAEILAPSFFERHMAVPADCLMFLFGSDGWVLAQCVGHTIEGHAILEQAQLVSVPSAAPAGPDPLKLNRKAA